MRNPSRFVPTRMIAWFSLYTVCMGLLYAYPAHAADETIVIEDCRLHAHKEEGTGNCVCDIGYTMFGEDCVSDTLVPLGVNTSRVRPSTACPGRST
jgi:hypothetical protein